jgi:phosphoribosylaminoimidazole-succinocarboxamide synthase
MYDMGDRLLMVASDRISTYDVVPPERHPGQGQGAHRALAFWFAETGHIVPNHFVSPPTACPTRSRGRAIVARKLRCSRSSASCAATSPARAGRTTRRPGRSRASSSRPGLQESERLPQPIFTPSTKADVGHDEAIDFDQAAELVGDRDLMTRLRDARSRSTSSPTSTRARAA